MSTAIAPGQLIDARYQLERPLSAGGAGQGELWQATDTLASDAPVALRRVAAERDQGRARELWTRLQGLLHPQVPRFGAAISDGSELWLVREWQAGRTFGELLEARSERQLVFGSGEVLLLLRQLLPVLAALHSQELLHGDLCVANLLRRDSDGLPVLLDFGLVRGIAAAAAGATPGYAPPELARGEPAQPWMDLHALGVTALVLLSGDAPEALLDPVTLEWCWPAALDAAPALAVQMKRLVSRDPGSRFASAGQALVAFRALPMPDSSGPVPRADRTVALVPQPEPPPESAAASVAVAAAPEPGAVAGETESEPHADPAVSESFGQELQVQEPHGQEAGAAARLRVVPPPALTAEQLQPPASVRARSREEAL
ncbi:MAG: protein kinase domain-containing protein [Cyanobium sp.]